MAWLILAGSGVLEAVWATALGASDGFRRRTPTIVFLVALVASVATLAYAMTSLPAGTAYAVWVGIGAILTITFSVIRKTEVLTPARALLLVALVGCIIGLKVVS